jgi:FixJ family two-component response regulator
VEAFASAEEFLKSDHLPNTRCLILDVRMPGMNGLELQCRLAASHREIPIIFITAQGDEAARLRANPVLSVYADLLDLETGRL